MPDFCHLHVHTQYSLLDGASAIGKMLDKAVADGQTACAISDHGNMFGAFEFVNEANKRKLLPIVGCEFYLVEDRHRKTFTRQEKDQRFHQLLLAKNPQGYKNLSKLCSLGFIEGLYSKWPRIDKELLLQYHEGLIATSCCIGAEIPQAIIHQGEEEAEKIFLWWLDVFGEDFYVELQRHFIPDIDGTGISQEQVNQTLLRFARKHGVKVICTNDAHYIDKQDASPHDVLLCVNTGELQATPIGDGKGKRFGFHNDEFFFKTKAEMAELFADVPEAVDFTAEIASKIEAPQLSRDILLPNFPLPPGFATEDDYLRHLAFEGAKRKYGEVTQAIAERLDYELRVIADMGFPGYFLIVQDFIKAAKDLGVRVGPGRGSAAGSCVAYCTDITNIDPIGYNLLFERFLNPERVSMPDIDIDFDDAGRGKVIDYVVNKYGKDQVAQIVTFGTMAARSAIRDVGRVLDLPLPEVDKIAKLVPGNPGMTLRKAMDEVPELKEIHAQDSLPGQTLRTAEALEGSYRHTGLHAAGVIIAPENLLEHIPVCTAKDAELWVTQFDGRYVESAGMLKMDFLGLKTLSIIHEACANVRLRHGREIDPEAIPLDDAKTYELFQEGRTVGIFQFESAGMQRYLKELKPTNIEDLIAMNALYRPGPMDFIPLFVDRKHGRKPVEYPHPLLEELLQPTYGIMVYQEQIMQTAQIIGGFSLGAADILRRAMGKKKMDVMEQQKLVFIDGARERGIDEKKATEIFDVMAQFAKYGFNRSHSAAYSVLAYQTAWLKAHYPAEYMAAVLTNNKNDIKQINFFLRECQQLGVALLGPDVNESAWNFTVNPEGAIRFALSAIKGVGGAAVEQLIEERETGGPFGSLFDLTRRVNLRAVNKKCLESLAQAGAFDAYGLDRAVYLQPSAEGHPHLVESAVKHGQAFQQSRAANQNSLFGALDEAVETADPEIPQVAPWSLPVRLRAEKEVTGIYLSGHPLDDYTLELKTFTSCPLADAPKHQGTGRPLSLGGMVATAQHRTTKRGTRFGIVTLEDFTGELEFALFGEDYLKFKHFIDLEGTPLFLQGSYQPRFRNAEELEFKVSHMMLLENVRDEKAKRFTVQVPLEGLSAELVEGLERVCAEHPGKFPLGVRVLDHADRYSVDLLSRRFRVDGSNRFAQRLEQELGLRYALS